MEKNIKKRVCRLAAVLSAVLVLLFGYWFFLNPHGYWQKQKEAEREEYSPDFVNAPPKLKLVF